MSNIRTEVKKIFGNPDTIAAIFGIVGVLAVLINLFINEVTLSTALDSLKEIIGLGIAVGIYWLANKIYSTKKHQMEFHEMFELQLQEWAEKNRFLIEPRCRLEDGRTGKEGNLGDHYRYYKMVTDHTRLINRAEAIDESDNKKGVFIKLPYLKQEEGYDKFRFFFTESVFVKPEKGITSVKPIIDSMTKCLKEEYTSKIIGITITSGSKEITVDISAIDRSDLNQDDTIEKLIDMIDFVKILYLAQA